jgi:YidC/Oxa1 family membrane protein insertase
MTPSARRRLLLGRWLRLATDRRILAVVALVAVATLLVACAPLGVTAPPASSVAVPGASIAPTATPVPTNNPNSIPLHPATPTDPISAIAWLFTPIFQALLILLVFFEQLTGNMAIAIVIVTLIVRFIQVPLFRRQTVSTRRMQLVQPELREIQKRYKGDRTKAQAAQAEFYKERGINPLAGCLPMLLFLVLLFPMYQVFSSGLQNVDPSGMLKIFGIPVIHLNCGPVPPPHPSPPPVIPCINSTVLGINLSQPSVLFTTPIFAIGISVLAIISALLQLVQSRMAMPAGGGGTDDPNTRIQRQTMIFVPFISVFYGGILPAGLFIYWIVSTIFSIVQQYLILGWGGMFPLFGWTPGFARDHTPRFPVAVPAPDPTKRAPSSVLTNTDERAARAGSTVRPRERSGRKGRRGRRR